MTQTPAYRKLHKRLRSQILSGQFEIGGLLPSENELSKQHKINRMTVRQALNELVHEGLIEKRAGKGSIVTANRKTLGLLSFKGFSEVTGLREMDASTDSLSPATATSWPQPFFYELSKREAEADCVQLTRLRKVEEHPVMLEYTYIPKLNLPELERHLHAEYSLFRVLQAQYGIEVKALQQDIRAIAADPDQAQHLQVETGAPILHLYRKYGTSRNGLHVYSSLFCNTQKFTIGNTF